MDKYKDQDWGRGKGKDWYNIRDHFEWLGTYTLLNEVWRRVGDQIWDQINNQVLGQVGGQIREDKYGQV